MNEVINEEDEIEHVVIYANRKNKEKIYIPVILRIKKDEFPHYEYIKTVDVGSSKAHILMGGGYYYMCISKDDCVSTDKKFMEPLGYSREKLEDLEKMADTYLQIYIKEQKKPTRPRSNKYPMVVVPPILDNGKEWHMRMYGHNLVNVETKEVVPLWGQKTHISEKTRLSIHMIDAIIRTGILANNWCVMATRVDGRSWDEVLSRVS